MKIGVIQDLAIGVHPFGADTWAMGRLLTSGFRVGAPPDMFSPAGQDWTQPPWNPVTPRTRRSTGRSATSCASSCGTPAVCASTTSSGMFRLWWIPPGAKPIDGTYVRYDHQALLDILCLEASPRWGHPDR